MNKDTQTGKNQSATRNILKISITAMFAAFTLISTAFLKIPIALGYIHLGDVFVMLAAFFLPMGICIPIALIAPMLADLIAGYVIYMPVTALAKTILVVFFRLAFVKDKQKIVLLIALPVIGAILHTVVYFMFEGFFYGWGAAVANLPLAIIQPIASIVVCLLAIVIIKRIPYFMRIREMMVFLRKKKANDKTDFKDDRFLNENLTIPYLSEDDKNDGSKENIENNDSAVESDDINKKG